ncbi:MAG: TIGR02996 domain-containing protein [Polyangiaceae bacterium]
MDSERALLEAVYDDPRSDAPREVYADWLTSRSNPLGELITLQLAKARGRRVPKSREEALFRERHVGWWSDHPCVIAERPTALRLDQLERGFPAHYLPNSESSPLTSTIGRTGWATVTELTLPTGLADDVLVALLARSPLRSLTWLHGLRPTSFERVADLNRAVRGVTLFGVDGALPVPGWPALDSLALWLSRPTALDAALAVATALVAPPRLVSLELRQVVGGQAGGVSLCRLVEVHRQLGLRRLATQEPYVKDVTLQREGDALTLRVKMEGAVHQSIANMLAELDPSAVQQLEVDLTPGPRRLETDDARARIERYTSAWPKERVKLGWRRKS